MHDQIQFISNNITKSVNQIFENKTSVIDGLTFYLYNSIANTTHDKSTSYLNFNKQSNISRQAYEKRSSLFNYSKYKIK